MARLIDKDAAYAALKHEEETHKLPFTTEAFEKAARIIDQMPIIEAQPAQYGRWVHRDTGYSDSYLCSACGTNIVLTDRWRFCPNCGVKMENGMWDDERKASELWCENCDHIEMCKWYPICGCEFRQIGGKSLRSDLKKQTNGDRIRQMTDEELANLLLWNVCNVCDGREYENCGDDKHCNSFVLKWLKQEVPDDGSL